MSGKDDQARVTVHTSSKSALGEVMKLMRLLKAGRTPYNEPIEDAMGMAWWAVVASVNMKSVARTLCHRVMLTHAEVEADYVKGAEQAVSDRPTTPEEQRKMELMGMRSPEAQAFDGLPVADVAQGLFELSISAEEMREDYLMSDRRYGPELLLGLGRMAYNARSMFEAVAGGFDVDPDEIMTVAEEMMEERVEETNARAIIDEANRREQERED